MENKHQILAPNSSELNLLDTEQVEQYLKIEKIDILIHTANANNTRKKNVTPYDSLNNNLRMFYNLERCNAYYDKMYFFGSGAEYDMNHYIPSMKEEYLGTYIPQDSYGFSKYIMSKTAKTSGNIYDLTLFGVYGKYEEWERRFISNAICRALMGKPITIQKNVYFDYLWIDDLCNIMDWFLQNNPEQKHYNICSGRKTDLYSLACMIREEVGAACDILVSEEGYKPEYTGDNSKILQEIGDFQFKEYRETIKLLVQYYRENIDMIDGDKLL